MVCSRFGLSRHLLIAAMLLLSASAGALDPHKQVTQYGLRSWTTGDGMPQDTVRALAQTPDGYLWMGTEAGLVRFDGMTLQVFDRSTHPELFANGHVYALAVDHEGTLWIGTYGRGVVVYRDGIFQRSPIEMLHDIRITAFEATASGTLWIGTYGHGLIRWRDGRAIRFDLDDGLPHPVIFDLEASADGSLWVATYGGGLARWRDGLVDSWTVDDGLPVDDLWALHERDNGELWIATNRGLVRWREGEIEQFTVADGLPHQRAISILEDRHGQLWVGTYGGGLTRFSDGRFDTLNSDHGLGSDAVWSLFEDREGGVWVGTLGGGVHQLVEGAFVSFSLEEGLSSRLPSAIVEAPDGGLWIATRDRGVDRLIEGRVERLDATDLSSNNTWTVWVDRRDELWVGTSGAGLDHRDASGRWHHYTTRDGLPDNVVFDLAEATDGGLWISTNDGLGRFDGVAFRRFSTEDGLASNQVRRLLVDRSGRLWVGTTRGLSRSDGEGAFVGVADDVLGGQAIQDLLEDADGSLWVASSGGLTRWREGLAHQFTRLDGLPDDNLRGLVLDDHGSLWLATSRGVSRVDRVQLDALADGASGRIDAVTYGLRDGLKSSVCYGGSPVATKTSDGRLWFTTLDGIATVDPASTRSVPAPPVRIEGLWVDGEPTVAHEVAPGRHTFEIRFAVMNLRIPDKIRVRYRLVGFEDRWSETRGGGVATYNNLGPGDYVLTAMASDELGRFVGEPSTFAFSVAPAFHQRPLAWCLAVIAFGLIGFASHGLRVRHLTRREQELSLRVEEAKASLKMLRGLLPMCSHCKRIRDDQGYWEQLETYLSDHSEASLSHGICPDCVEDHFGELFDEEESAVRNA